VAEGSPSGAVSPRCSWTYDTSQDGGIIGIIVKPGDSAGGLSFGGSATTSYQAGGTVFEAPTPSGGVAFSGTASLVSGHLQQILPVVAWLSLAPHLQASERSRRMLLPGIGVLGAAGKCWTKIAAQVAAALSFSGAATTSYVEAGDRSSLPQHLLESRLLRGGWEVLDQGSYPDRYPNRLLRDCQ